MATIEAIVRNMVRETRTLEHLKRGRAERTIATDSRKQATAGIRDRADYDNPRYNRHHDTQYDYEDYRLGAPPWTPKTGN